MILRMDEFDTDYSFLNLPEAGSDVRGPISLPSIEPVSFDLFGGRRPIRRPRPEPIEIQPLRRIERGDDQGRFEMGRAIGQEVNMLRENIQTLETAKGELASERDAAIQMQDQIRQQMSEQRIQELDQQQAQLQAELQEAVAAAEARGIDALAEAEAQAAEELASVSADFQSQIDALTGERDQAIAEQDMIRAEAAEQQAQALEAQKQNYESQLAALQQAPADTSLLDARRQELQDIGYDPADVEEILERDQQRGLENVTSNVLPDMIGKQPPFNLGTLGQEQPQYIKDMVARSMETGEPVISPDQVQDMINRMGGQAGPVEAPQMPPKKDDQIFIDDREIDPRINRTIGTGTGFIGGPLTVADTPFTGAGMAGAGIRPDLPPPTQSALFGKRPTITRPATPIPQAPAITPPRRPMSVGGIGGMGGRMNRMMVR